MSDAATRVRARLDARASSSSDGEEGHEPTEILRVETRTERLALLTSDLREPLGHKDEWEERREQAIRLLDDQQDAEEMGTVESWATQIQDLLLSRDV